MTGFVTRFAPSPTGYLHLGHVVAALYVWGIGRRCGAKILLRIEDHDSGRSRPAFEESIYEDLQWLGFTWDAPPERQSERRTEYDAALVKLAQVTEVYACDCSRARVDERNAESSSELAAELYYDGHCRYRALPFAPRDVGLRCNVSDAEERFDDLILGRQAHIPAHQCGDMLLRDRNGDFTYQLAVVVDDIRQGIDLVIRGQDLTASTGRQIALARLLGRQEPARFAHHRLLVDADGRKLGKRFFADGVVKRRTSGERAEDVLGEAAFLAGLIPMQRGLAVQDLPMLFDDVAKTLLESRQPP